MDKERFARQIRDEALSYISGRKRHVEAGRETAELSALLAEKYCVGLIIALRGIHKEASIDLYDAVLRALPELDPHWETNCARRRDGIVRARLELETIAAC